MSKDDPVGIAERTIVVTGAASGIGRAIAQGFLADGARVVACDIQENGLAEIGTLGAITQRTDVRSQPHPRFPHGRGRTIASLHCILRTAAAPVDENRATRLEPGDGYTFAVQPGRRSWQVARRTS